MTAIEPDKSSNFPDGHDENEEVNPAHDPPDLRPEKENREVGEGE